MFGSAVDALEQELEARISDFLRALKHDTPLGDGFAVAHGSGPGIMKAVDDAAAGLGVFRLGMGIDVEGMGQAPNMAPEALVQFKAGAMNTRQDILDRRSIFKVFNIGGFGTSYELSMALTFMKIGHCLPAPYILVDPFGLGPEGGNLWEPALSQMRIIASPYKASGAGPLGPAWVPKCCHAVGSYGDGLEIIKEFVSDPAGYWQKAGVPMEAVVAARDNLILAGVTIPPYIAAALKAD